MALESRQERELSHWKQWESKADAVWGWQTPAGRVRADRRAALFRQVGAMTSDSVVLELGCGTGEFTTRIAEHVGKLMATDLTPAFLDRARQRVGQECPGAAVTFGIEDAMSLRLQENHFDAVFGCSILHHLDAVVALREVFRVLKPGGRCVFSEPNMLNPQIAVQKNVKFIKRWVGDTGDERAFFRGQMIRLLRDAGFAEIGVHYFDFVHPLIPAPLLHLAEVAGSLAETIPGIRALSGSLFITGRKESRP